MLASEGIVRDIISPLVKRLDIVSSFPGNETDLSAIIAGVEKIKKQLLSLKEEYGIRKMVEGNVRNDFGVVVRHVDEMLENARHAPSDSARNSRLREDLGKIEEELEGVIERRNTDEFEGVIKRRNRDIISPLIKRLDSVSRLPGEGTDSSAINEIVKEIKEELQSLKNEFELGKITERNVSMAFRSVVQHVDEILKNANANANANTQLREDLEKIKEEIKRIKEEKNKGGFSIPDTQEDGRASDSVHSSRPSEAKQQARLRVERSILESDAMSHLRLIIENLDTRLKHCLFCLTVFPQDAVMKKRLLIHWWIGEDIVSSAEDGKQCFTELGLRSLIIPIKEKKHCETAHSCKLHPWIRELLMSIATSNAFLEFDSDGSLSKDYSRTRRAFLGERPSLAGPSNQKGKAKEAEDKKEEEEEEEEEEEDRTLTLYNLDAKYVEIESNWFAGKKELCALQLGRWQRSVDHHIEFAGNYLLKDLDLGACKKLRYLSLRGMSRVESLPDSIGSLRKLVVLDLRACHNLEALTSKVSSLENLEYLDVAECYLLDKLPKGLKNLRKLQVLKGFIIAHATGKDACHLSELATLLELRKLSISVGQGSNVRELEKLTEFKASLNSLTIRWGVVGSEDVLSPAETKKMPGNAVTKERKLASAIPSPIPSLEKLEKLDIRAFPGEFFPEWISPGTLPKLKKLYIRGGRLRTLGEGWTMEVLRIRFLKHLSCDAGKFPNLRILEIFHCPKMSSWPRREGMTYLDGDDAREATKDVLKTI